MTSTSVQIGDRSNGPLSEALAGPHTNPLVSVVMPVYNGDKFLAEALDSVLSQTWENWELVLIDNASTDQTATIVTRYQAMDDRVRSVRNPATVSVIENHNVAVANMSIDAVYCKVLHADDRLEAQALADMVALGEQHPSVNVIGCWAQWGDRVMSQIKPHSQSFFRGRDIGRRTLLGEFYPFLSPSCLLLRASALRARGSFYKGENLHADVDAAFELLSDGDFAIRQRVLAHIRAHDDSVTAAAAAPMNTLIASNLQLLGQHGPTFLSPVQLRKRRTERLRRYYVQLARAWIEGRSAEFWHFHRQSMALAGWPMSSARVKRNALRLALRHPIRQLRLLLKRFKQDE